MCLILMHSENMEDQMICLKSLQELKEWSLQEGVDDMAKAADQYYKFGLSHKD